MGSNSVFLAGKISNGTPAAKTQEILFSNYNPILCHVSSHPYILTTQTHNDPAAILQPQLIN